MAQRYRGISIHTVPNDSDRYRIPVPDKVDISIHTVPKDSDSIHRPLYNHRKHFNPHRPEGQWQLAINATSTLVHFNPHRPEGQWLFLLSRVYVTFLFQSTPSRRTVTRLPWLSFLPEAISIHTVPKDSDLTNVLQNAGRSLFQSTPSRRTVTRIMLENFYVSVISIHTVPKDSDS